MFEFVVIMVFALGLTSGLILSIDLGHRAMLWTGVLLGSFALGALIASLPHSPRGMEDWSIYLFFGIPAVIFLITGAIYAAYEAGKNR